MENMGTNIELGVELAVPPEINEYSSKTGAGECCCDGEVQGCAGLDCSAVDCSDWVRVFSAVRRSCVQCGVNARTCLLHLWATTGVEQLLIH